MTFCGVDGSGKSTVVEQLAALLRLRGRTVAVRTPLVGDRSFATDVRLLRERAGLASDTSRDFLADYFSHVLVRESLDVVAADLADGVIVLCERYLRSHRANQAAFGVDLSHLDPLFELLPQPDVEIYIDVPVDVALERIAKRRTKGIGDDAAYLTRVSEELAEFCRSERVARVDGTLPCADVVAAVERLVLERLDRGRSGDD